MIKNFVPSRRVLRKSLFFLIPTGETLRRKPKLNGFKNITVVFKNYGYVLISQTSSEWLIQNIKYII